MLVFLVFSFCACGGGNARSGPISIGPTEQTQADTTTPAPDAKSTGESGAGAGFGEPPPGGLDWPEPGEDAGPLEPQSLFDFEADRIGPWGPVIATIQVELQGGGTMTVNRLSSSDPFTATYQLEDGTIVVSNEDLSEIAVEPVEEQDPPIVQWTDPDNETWNIFEGEIITYFADAATQSDIEQFIADHNLHVIMSWFEPPDEGQTGNALAWFHFEYDEEEFPTFDDAFNFFAANDLIESVWPGFSDGLYRWYTGNTDPNDFYYQDDETRHINIFGVDQSQLVPLGPSNGNWFSDQVVAVIDDGVDRWHEDFHINGYPWYYRKISWVGVDVLRRTYRVRFWGGEPNWFDVQRQGFASHGTSVSGLIAASTNNAGTGVASLSPQVGILPLRMRMNASGRFYTDCEVKAVHALRKAFAHGQWHEYIRVVNMSFGDKRPWYWWINPLNKSNLKRNINWDLNRSDRLYVSGAGNIPPLPGGNWRCYPAAHDNVLGVSGLITNFPGSQFWSNLGGWGSNYRYDNYETYPVSGIFEFREHYLEPWNFDTWIYRTTSCRGEWQYATWYDSFGGTSACAPEASALAALLYTERPWVNYRTVWNRIVSTRDDSTARYPIAGLMDFEEALTGW